MKIKNVLVFILPTILCWPFMGVAQTVKYVSLETACTCGVQYTVQTNQIVSLVGASGAGNVSIQYPDGQVFSQGVLLNSLNNPTSVLVQSYTGLTTITVKAAQNGSICTTFQITTPATASVISNYVPADAIVIPTSVSGNVQIILESSPDLMNWTAANPGTYGASDGTNRFFRVRAAVSP